MARFRDDRVARFRVALIDQIGSARHDQAGMCEHIVVSARSPRELFSIPPLSALVHSK